MNTSLQMQVHPGFRFHPTDEELVEYYLKKKVASTHFELDVIKDVDLHKVEPWDLQELCRMGIEGQNEWYFFSHKDKKYPTGTRTNRATAAGFWKATGYDKAVYSKHDHGLIGMRKTLVFYKGRAPNSQKSDWIMHEFRLESDENGSPREEGWVVCKLFKKRIASTQKLSKHEQVSVMGIPEHNSLASDLTYSSCPNSTTSLLGSPNNMDHGGCNLRSSSSGMAHQEALDHQVTDWRVLEKIVASRLSHEEIIPNENLEIGCDLDKQEIASTSICHIDNLWN